MKPPTATDRHVSPIKCLDSILVNSSYKCACFESNRLCLGCGLVACLHLAMAVIDWGLDFKPQFSPKRARQNRSVAYFDLRGSGAVRRDDAMEPNGTIPGPPVRVVKGHSESQLSGYK